MSERILLSICLPTFNRAKLLRSCLYILAPQVKALGNLVELIVSDNCSTDETPAVVQEAQSWGPIRYSRNEANLGAPGNIFVLTHQLARGEFAWIIGDDDLVRFDGLTKILAAIQGHPEIDFIFVNTTTKLEPERPTFEDLCREGLDNVGLLPTKALFLGERFLEKFEDLIEPTVDTVFMGSCMCGVFRLSLWNQYTPTFGEPYSTLTDTYSHTMAWAHTMIGRRTYYIGYPCTANFFGHQEWTGFVPLIFTVRLQELLDLYVALGVDRERVERCRTTLLDMSTDALAKMLFEPATMGRQWFCLDDFLWRNRFQEARLRDMFKRILRPLIPGPDFDPDTAEELVERLSQPICLLPSEGEPFTMAPLLKRGSWRPLVSVVIPTYNQAHLLPESVQSLIAQTYSNWEAVIVNDGSTDDTLSVMEELARRDSRIRVFSKENGGVSAALNFGIERARGEFFCWLSSDDVFYPDMLESLLSVLEGSDEHYALAYGCYDHLLHERKEVEVLPYPASLTTGAEFAEALKFDFINGCTVMVRMSVFAVTGPFCVQYHHNQDAEMWMRIASYGFRFKYVPKKVMARRIHLAQASTINMIYCRYDAAWMVNFYLERFHLLELYRHFDFTQLKGIIAFLTHFVDRMLHTDSTVNNPLLLDKFWAWFDEGLNAFEPKLQEFILLKCRQMLFHNRPLTPKLDLYIRACQESLAKPRVQKPLVLPQGMAGRNIFAFPRNEDRFGDELFDYLGDLLVNVHTPLIAQEILLHEVNKNIDSHYKLAHSLLRYLSQFPNRYCARLAQFKDLVHIPQNSREALALFCQIRYPEFADDLRQSAEFDVAEAQDISSIEAAEARIGAMPPACQEDLRRICDKNPTEKILHYWVALQYAAKERYAEAAAAGWKALRGHAQKSVKLRSLKPSKYSRPSLDFGRITGDWRIAFRVGAWAEKANELANAFAGYLMGYGVRPAFLPFRDGIRRLRRANLWSNWQPAPKPTILGADPSRLPSAKLVYYDIIPTSRQYYSLRLMSIAENRNIVTSDFPLKYPERLTAQTIYDHTTQKTLQISPRNLFEVWVRAYSFARESQDFFQTRLKTSSCPQVAFSLLSSNSSDSAQTVFRWASWLAELGCDVGIYAKNPQPENFNSRIKYHEIQSHNERYSSIHESVLILESVFELPLLLNKKNLSGKRIFHLCQSIEDFNHPGFGDDIASLRQNKPIFELLHSLPVGRIATSKHLQAYFETQYRQRTFLIANGVNLGLFRPKHEHPLRDQLNVLVSACSHHPLDGLSNVKKAVRIVLRRNPSWKIRLMVVHDRRVFPDASSDTSLWGFSTTLYGEVEPHEFRNLLLEADVYVDSAWYRGSCSANLMAMASGVPVIQTDNLATEGISVHQQNCLLIPPNHAEAMAAAVEEIVSNVALRRTLIHGGYDTAKNNSLVNEYLQFVQVFEEIMAIFFDQAIVNRKRQEIGPQGVEFLAGEQLRFIKPLFSVLVLADNSADCLSAALESLIQQKYEQWEAVVVVQGSCEESINIAESYANQDFRIRLFHTDRLRLAEGYNEAYRQARGDWICFLPPGTSYNSEKLAMHVELVRENPLSKFHYTHYLVQDERIQEIVAPTPVFLEKAPEPMATLIYQMCADYIKTGSVALHHSLFEQAGFFQEEYVEAYAYDLWLRTSALHPAVFINERTCIIKKVQFADDLSAELRQREYGHILNRFFAEHSFEQLFPETLLDDAKHVCAAFQLVLELIVNPASCLRSSGATTGLIRLISAWLKSAVPPRIATEACPVIRSLLQQAIASQDCQTIKDSLLEVLGITDENCSSDADYGFLGQIQGGVEGLPE